jgi:hypothetical protein
MYKDRLTYCDIGYDLRAKDYFEQSLVICEDNADFHGQVCMYTCIDDIHI